MASGATDRLDVTAWMPATRTSWDAAGIAARTGTSAQDRFGAALDAARTREDAAAAQARAASQRDATDAARARQTSQRAEANASRDASERDRDAAAQAEARAADRRSAAAQPKSAATSVTTHASTPAAVSRSEGPQASPEPAPEASAPAQRAASAVPGQDETASKVATAGTPTKDPATDASATNADAPTQAEPAAQASQADATAQPAHPDPAATLLSLIAALSGGAAARATAAKGANSPEDPAAIGDSSPAGTPSVGAGATLPTPAASGSTAFGTGIANAAGGAEITGVSGPGVGAAHSAPANPNASPVEAVQTGTGDPSPAASGPGTDFLAVLADAGQTAGPAAATNPAGATPQGAGLANLSGSPATPTASAGAANAAQATPTENPATTQTSPPIPIGQVPMTIGLRSLNGSNAFQIRLDPIELGRVDVKLEIDKARGTVTTHLVVDRPETLAMLQRDANQLQQALTQAGLDPSAGGLNLSLRGDGSAQTGSGGNNPQSGSSQGGAAGWTWDQAEAPQEIAPTRWLRGTGGLDIRI